MIKAIETAYQGYRFRSRLEARWAVYFDALDIAWDYEPEGFQFDDGTRYLPDFWLPQVSMWAEVKPGPFLPVEVTKCHYLAVGSGFPCLMLNGMPDGRSFWACEPDGAVRDYVVGGRSYWLSERRFFTMTGESFPSQVFYDLSPSAIMAARGARFEFGESGARRR